MNETEVENNMAKYLAIDKQIKQLEEEQKLYKDAIELWMKENNQEKLENDLGQISLKEFKGAKRLNKALAEKFLSEEQLNSIIKEGNPQTRLTIISKESLEARKKFLENKNKQE